MTPDRPEEPDRPDPERLGLTRPGPLVTFGLVGLVAGWALRLVLLQLGADEPGTSWAPAFLLGFAAAGLAAIAWFTRRALARPHGLEPYQAVNRMVLGKASALVGAALLGFYAGRGIAQLGMTSELVGQRLTQSAVAAVTGAAVMLAALWLERACLVRSSGEDDLGS